MKKVIFLLLAISVFACQSKDTVSDEVLAEGDSLENPFIHSVYFWFKEGLSQEQLDSFYRDTEKLRQVEVVKALYTGKPANTTRPIVERSYDFAVIVHFKDLAAHDAYQQDPIHLNLLEKHSDKWEKVMITDVEN
ncbi:Dabb family protein [Roseivirga sp.]|uniref:Dabb family protein n=1 Tax=Roseivirga sp. TaxID=1964215 RepID=UPI003B5156AB